MLRFPRVRGLATSAVRASAWQVPPVRAPKSTATIRALQAENIPVTCVTAYDNPTALAIRGADVDICLVGDSLANVALGRASTRQFELHESIAHARTVREALSAPGVNAFAEPILIVDMPFGSYGVSVEESMRNVIRVVKETGAAGVKLEGTGELVPLVERLTSLGILVMGHIGLLPQRAVSASEYRVQGNTADSALEVYRAAKQLDRAGCFSMVIECIPAKLGEYITKRINAATIGIGAGAQTSGQVLVCTDIISDLTSPAHVAAVLDAQHAPQDPVQAAPYPASWPAGPKFVRSFAYPHSVGAARIEAIQRFVRAVRDRSFPDHSESYRIKSAEWASFVERADLEP
ncbi:3-methyl-2-oxobutanoate hydroxymethyltransferase [Malassezia cuniculi]|uniref:3-methyl-2-oxobutanoate hydroxymethyltransferase n=1 Tax=Malassezia cuniculi TaxID=948313 RepID=A0AAF0EUT9_9BASI|nr:3-methyl-2-oxobutanoate hydroxymethyltransferase [Malassezia cuniculi]